MTYFNIIYNYIKYLNIVYGFKTTLFLISLILILSISCHKLYNYKKKTQDLKIYKIYENFIFIILYLLFFIIFIVFLRYNRFGMTFDLNYFFGYYLLLFIKLVFILKIIVILFLLNIFLIMIRIKQISYKQLKKSYLYYYFSLKIKNNNNHFVLFLDKIENIWCFPKLVDKFILHVVINPYCKLKQTESYSDINLIIKLLKFLIKNFAIIMLLFLLFYDCIFNNNKIHLIFYYLPLYFVFQNWVSLSTFINNTNKLLNGIIYERYYKTEDILYVNTTNYEDNFLLLYIEKGLKCPTKQVSMQEVEKYMYFGLLFIQTRQFIRIKNTNIFKNIYTQETFILEKNE